MLNPARYWLFSLFLPHTTYFKPEMILLSKTVCVDLISSNAGICNVDVNFHLKALFQSSHYSPYMNIRTTTLKLRVHLPLGRMGTYMELFLISLHFSSGFHLFQIKHFTATHVILSFLPVFKFFHLYLLV